MAVDPSMSHQSQATKVPLRSNDELIGGEMTTSAQERGTVQGREWTNV